ncbi:MAG: helix-turn-helix transcriptional regulator [Chromatiales bacterium]|nr:helix-turn-helix transcriptional regulator [Chromatiales bacterium]
MSEFKKARRRVEVSVGESLRIVRELQGFSQNELAARTGIPQSTLSALERGRVNLGVERAKTLARVLKVHPSVLVFPGWDLEHESEA